MIEPDDIVITNARIVLGDSILHGSLTVEAGRIVDLRETPAAPGSLDLGGDYLLPGLIELHTDNLEAHLEPRPKVVWNSLAAVLAYDAQMAAAGITTVFDSLRAGSTSRTDNAAAAIHDLADSLDEARRQGALRAEHLTHLRCEIATGDVIEAIEAYMKTRPVHLMSLMDHTPGQRQFRDTDKMRAYYNRHGFIEDNAFDGFVEERMALHRQYAEINRRRIVAAAHERGAVLASHDDETEEHVAEAATDKVSIAEFPTTAAAARASHEIGIKVLMGAPNLVRGGSHSGNIAARDLAEAGMLDILSSDYVPASLLLAAFGLPAQVPGIDLAHAIALVTKNPAEAVGLTDRGEIAIGKRADLVWVSDRSSVPMVRRVWREGRRVV